MSNNHLHLLDRIKNINVSIIEDMSYDAMAMITDGFNESLVRNVVYIGKTNREQRKIIRCIKNNYKCWKKDTEILWGTFPQYEVYPEYLLEMQMDIECGMVVTSEGSVSEPLSKPFVTPPVLGESLRKLKGLSKTVAEDNTQELRAIIEKQNRRIAELETEVKTLNERTHVAKSKDIDEIFPNKNNHQKQCDNHKDERIAGLTNEVKRLKEENTKYKELFDFANETGEEKLKDEEKMTLRERLVFFFTVLSLDNDKKYTILSNLAKLINGLCNDQRNIVSFISRMKKPEEAAANAKAAKRVASLMKLIIPSEYRNDEKLTINRLIKNMELNFPSEEE